MTCADVDRLFSEGISARELKLRPAVMEHMQSCRRCEDLVSWTETAAPDPGLGEAVDERIRSFIRADLKPVRPLPSTLGAIGGAFVLAGTISLMHALTMGVRGWTALSRLQALWLGGLFVGVILLASASLIASIRPGSRQRVNAVIPILTLALGFPILIVWLFSSGSREHFVSDGVRCLAGGLMVAAMAAGITYALASRGYSTNWPRTGATIGVIGGVVAILGLQISCPDLEFGHLIVWHGLAMMMSIAGGYVAGRRTMAS